MQANARRRIGRFGRGVGAALALMACAPACTNDGDVEGVIEDLCASLAGSAWVSDGGDERYDFFPSPRLVSGGRQVSVEHTVGDTGDGFHSYGCVGDTVVFWSSTVYRLASDSDTIGIRRNGDLLVNDDGRTGSTCGDVAGRWTYLPPEPADSGQRYVVEFAPDRTLTISKHPDDGGAILSTDEWDCTDRFLLMGTRAFDATIGSGGEIEMTRVSDVLPFRRLDV